MDYATADQFVLGTGESEVVTEHDTPTDFEFDVGEDQSVRQKATVRVSNPGTESATEDITLTLTKSFGGTDTPVAEETKTGVTVAAGDVNAPEFLSADAHLPPGTYHVTVTTSGTALTVEQVEVSTRDVQVAWELGTDGVARLIDHSRRMRMRVSPFESGVVFPEGIVDQQGARVASFEGAGLSVSSGETPTLQAATVTDAGTVTVSGDGTATFSLPHGLGVVPDAASVTPASAAAAGEFWRSNLTDSAVEITYTSAPQSGTDNLVYDVVVVGSP